MIERDQIGVIRFGPHIIRIPDFELERLRAELGSKI